MTSTAELLSTFETLAVSQRANADRIEAAAIAQMGSVPSDFATMIAEMRQQAVLCDESAAALRSGDAVSIDE